MFKPGLTVWAGRVVAHVDADGRRAEVSFRQFWKQGSYADQGPKQMTLRRSNGGWTVLHEELLASEPWDGTPP